MRGIIALGILVTMGVMMTSCIGAGNISDIKATGDDYFPQMSGIDLHGNERVVPTSFNEPYSVIIIGFEREHQAPINGWIDATTTLQKTYPSLGLYELPIIYEVNAAYRFWINNGMRAGIEDDAARTRTITIYTDREEFTGEMSMQPDDIYTMLLANDGKVIWRNKGAITDDARNALADTLSSINIATNTDQGAAQ